MESRLDPHTTQKSKTMRSRDSSSSSGNGDKNWSDYLPNNNTNGDTTNTTPEIRNRIILCSNVLPVKFTKHNDTGLWTATMNDTSLFEDGPMYAGLKNLEHCEVLHVGVPEMYVPWEDKEKVEDALKPLNCYPVFLSPTRAHNHFQGYCKGVLWPTFHSVIDLYSSKDRMNFEDTKAVSAFDHSASAGEETEKCWKQARSYSPMEAAKYWDDYQEVNKKFSDKVVEVFNDNDIVWIHDYELLLLPSWLQRKLNNTAKIGLFVHIPFPSSEIFRSLGSREEILQGMLCAHHIGFHIFEYARHFLACCSRMLGYKHGALRGGSLAVYLGGGRQVSITCAHTSIDTPGLNDVLMDEQTMDASNAILAEHQLLSNAHTRMKFIVSIDEVEGLRGLTLKLLAFEKFLKMGAQWSHQVRFKQYGINIDSRPADNLQSKTEFIALMNKINAEYNAPVVEYEEVKTIDVHKRLAIMKHGDIFINTCVRSGIDVLPLEYILARGSGEEGAGVLILSEFAGCARVLHGSLRVNPWATQEVAKSIVKALTMPGAEREARRARDLSFLETFTLKSWGARVVSDIVDAHMASGASDALLTHGLGIGSRSYTEDRGKRLDVLAMLDAFRRAKFRYIFIDYSNTLVETTSLDMNFKSGGSARVWHYQSDGPGRRPGGGLETRDEISTYNKKYLKKISGGDGSRTVLTVISSDLREELAHAVEGIPNVALIAENGYVYRMKKGEQWKTVVNAKEMSSDDIIQDSGRKEEWIAIANSIMSRYAFRTNGAFVWTAPSAISFNYVLADSELGKLQGDNLKTELAEALKNHEVNIEPAKGSLTVRLKEVNRGSAIRSMMRSMPKNEEVFVACFGDDVEDESMFQAAGELKEVNPNVQLFTARVGRNREKESAAAFFVEDESAVSEIMEKLAMASDQLLGEKQDSAGFGDTDDGSNVDGSYLTGNGNQNTDGGIQLITKEIWRKSLLNLNAAGQTSTTKERRNSTLTPQSPVPTRYTLANVIQQTPSITSIPNLAALTQKNPGLIPPTASALALSALALPPSAPPSQPSPAPKTKPNQESSSKVQTPAQQQPQQQQPRQDIPQMQQQQHRQPGDDNVKLVIAAGAGAVLALVLQRMFKPTR